MKKAFAHVEDVHETTTESLSHYLELSPTSSIFTFFLIMLVVVLLLRKFEVGTSTILLIVIVLHFLGGVIGFMFVPALGVIAITIGFALALSTVLIGQKPGKPLK